MKFLKTLSLTLSTIFLTLILFTTNIFACACCADKGYYNLSYKTPNNYEIGQIKDIHFETSELYATNAFPDNIKGIPSPTESYKVSGSIGGDSWAFTFTDENGKTGTLSLKTPKKMIDYAVDIKDGKKGGAGGVVLYKEWRFKYRVAKGTGIFQNGIKGKTEYFLVLQGRGNACTSAEDFTHWRLEVTGKKADYTFHGTLKTKENGNTEANNLVIGNLKGKNYFGCGCSGITKKEAQKQNGDIFFWSEFKQNPKDETAIFNINGKDTEFNPLKKGKRPEKEKVGDKFTDEYVGANGTKIILDYKTKKLPCAECEGTDYDVTATIIGKFNGKVVSLEGSCGC